MSYAKHRDFDMSRIQYTLSGKIDVATKQIAKLVLSQRDLSVYAADEIEYHIHHDEERCTTNRERGNTGQDRHTYRQDCNHGEEECTDQSKASNHVTEVLGSLTSWANTWDKATVSLEVL